LQRDFDFSNVRYIDRYIFYLYEIINSEIYTVNVIGKFEFYDDNCLVILDYANLGHIKYKSMHFIDDVILDIVRRSC